MHTPIQLGTCEGLDHCLDLLPFIILWFPTPRTCCLQEVEEKAVEEAAPEGKQAQEEEEANGKEMKVPTTFKERDIWISSI